jgi:bifunctional DNA-binding transcriptional regulator/antitoxin component of YhaV-PrlF toxin-antitoxin module
MLAKIPDERRVVMPEEIDRRVGIERGDKLDWTLVEGSDAVLVRPATDRGALARRLCGLGTKLAPGRDLVAELDAEREDRERLRSLGA